MTYRLKNFPDFGKFLEIIKFLKMFDLEFHNFKLEIIIVVESLDNKIYQEK